MGTILALAGANREEIGARTWWRVGAGILSAATAAWMLGQLPMHGKHSTLQLVTRGVVLVVFPALAGAGVSRWLWGQLNEAEKAQFPFYRLALCASLPWVLMPPVALLLQRDSVWAPLMMMLAAAVSAVSLHHLVPVAAEAGLHDPLTTRETVLFGMLPPADSGIWLALALAAGLEGAAIPFVNGETFGAGLLLAAATFVLLWRRASWLPRSVRDRRGEEAAAKIAVALVFAILIATIALMTQLPGDAAESAAAKAARDREAAMAEAAVRAKEESRVGYGFKGIILWTEPKKKQIVAPAPMDPSLVAGESKRPIVIPFDGPYWYFQEPYDSPGWNAHLAHGDPTRVNIRSTDRLPLLMEAHQKLGSSVDLKCCRALEMDVTNGDNVAGGIALGVILTDTHSPGKPSLALGGQQVISSDAGHFSIKTSPVEEQLRYAIPERRGIRKFDEITVVFFPAPERSVVGVKVAIQDFVLLPR